MPFGLVGRNHFGETRSLLSPSSVTTQMINIDIFTAVRTSISQTTLKIRKRYHEVQAITQSAKQKLNAVAKKKVREGERSHQRCFNRLQDCWKHCVQQEQTTLSEMYVLI
jgi:hypothetical protein